MVIGIPKCKSEGRGGVDVHVDVAGDIGVAIVVSLYVPRTAQSLLYIATVVYNE